MFKDRAIVARLLLLAASLISSSVFAGIITADISDISLTQVNTTYLADGSTRHQYTSLTPEQTSLTQQFDLDFSNPENKEVIPYFDEFSDPNTGLTTQTWGATYQLVDVLYASIFRDALMSRVDINEYTDTAVEPLQLTARGTSWSSSTDIHELLDITVGGMSGITELDLGDGLMKFSFYFQEIIAFGSILDDVDRTFFDKNGIESLLRNPSAQPFYAAQLSISILKTDYSGSILEGESTHFEYYSDQVALTYQSIPTPSVLLLMTAGLCLLLFSKKKQHCNKPSKTDLIRQV